MKRKYMLAVVAAAFALAGCDQSKQAGRPAPEPSADINAPPAQVQREIMKTEVKEPLDVTKAYPTENRDMFVASMQQKLTELDQKISDLNDMITSLNTDEIAQATLNSLRELRAQLDPLFEELSTSSLEAWDDAKRAFESSLAELEKAYQEAKDTYDM